MEYAEGRNRVTNSKTTYAGSAPSDEATSQHLPEAGLRDKLANESECDGREPALPGRIRRQGAGRKKITETDPHLLSSLEYLIEPETRGDPESPLRWICKSTRTLALELTKQKHPVSHEKVAQILRDQNYSLQSNRKMEEGEDHPDRDAQFRHQSTSQASVGSGNAGYLRGHQEEGTARKLR